MTYEELQKAALEDAKRRVAAFLDEGVSSGREAYEIEKGWEMFATTLVTPHDINQILEDRGWYQLDAIETNGWQWDFWQTFEHPDHDRNLTMAGGGWYGRVRLYWSEEG